MIEAKILPEDGVLVVSPAGRLQREDFDRMRLLVNPYLEKNSELNGLLIDAEAFPGWEDFYSMLSHINFVRNYQGKIKRVAAVSDSGFLSILPKVADYFVAAEVRHFAYKQRDEALDWLRDGTDGA